MQLKTRGPAPIRKGNPIIRTVIITNNDNSNDKIGRITVKATIIVGI